MADGSLLSARSAQEARRIIRTRDVSDTFLNPVNPMTFPSVEFAGASAERVTLIATLTSCVECLLLFCLPAACLDRFAQACLRYADSARCALICMFGALSVGDAGVRAVLHGAVVRSLRLLHAGKQRWLSESAFVAV